MRRLCAILLSLSAPAWAYSTYGTYVPPEGLQPAQAAAPVVSAGSAGEVSATPGLWSFGLHVGAALPLGALGKYNGPGGMGGADVSYRLTPKWDLDLLGLYAAMPYTSAGGGAPSPLSTGGVAIKADYQVFNADQTVAWLGAGVGIMGEASTQHPVISTAQSNVIYGTEAETSAGLALLAAAGANYAFTPQWSVNLEILVLSLDADGGTSNNLLAAIPNLFVKWTY